MSDLLFGSQKHQNNIEWLVGQYGYFTIQELHHKVLTGVNVWEASKTYGMERDDLIYMRNFSEEFTKYFYEHPAALSMAYHKAV